MSTTAPVATHRHAPPALALVRGAMRIVGRVSPGLAAQWAHRMWLSPRVRPPGARDERAMAAAQAGRLSVDGARVATYTWGAGPCVLLVHGWSGRSSQYATLAPLLAAAGYRVLAFDAPAHGNSTGRRTNIFEIERVMRALAAASGPLHGIVAHSFGCACVALALRRGLPAARVVCLSPPSQMEWMLQAFTRTLALSDAVVDRLRARLVREVGGDYGRALSADMNARFLSVPALVVHDDDDQDVPWQQGAMLARAWPGARFERTRGLGHRRIVRDADVARRILEFLQGAQAAQ